MKKEIELYNSAIEFSPYEWDTVIALLAVTVHEMIKDNKKTYRYQLELKGFRIDHKKPKKSSQSED
jgi:hypothetical protein